MNQPIRVGIAGLGRSGWGIHAQGCAAMPDQFQVVAAMDFEAERRADAQKQFDARTYDSFDGLVADPNVELVIVSTPNFLHREHVVRAAEAGKHALCEKPFGVTTNDANAMIEAAQKAGTIAAPFQNRRYESHFQKVLEVVQSGVLGELHLVRLAVHGFGRRWDWQTLREFSGGQLLNWGAHILDHALGVMNLPDDAPEPELWADLRNVLSSGDAEDHIKMIIRPENGPVVDIEISSAMAMGQDRWLIEGKSGGLRGSTAQLDWRWVDWSQMPPRPVERTPTPGRSYNSEKLEWQSGHWEDDGTGDSELTRLFYEGLYRAIREGAPLEVSPQSVRRQIALIERAKTMTGFA